jgi:hypothetical protein
MRVLVMVVLIYALSAAHVMAQTPYDGIWNVTILTKAVAASQPRATHSTGGFRVHRMPQASSVKQAT